MDHPNLHLTEENDWFGCWCYCKNSDRYKELMDYQKIDHFPGSQETMRKDIFWKNNKRMRALHGEQQFNFMPLTFILSEDLLFFASYIAKNPGKKMWISKPFGMSGGKGITVFSSNEQLPPGKAVVQRYISKPYLIQGRKFDIRLHVYVPTIEPLRIYLHDGGVVKFATKRYSNAPDTQTDDFVHLTNVYVNIKHPDYSKRFMDFGEAPHKWSLQSLWNYLRERGVDTNRIWMKFQDMIIKQFIGGVAGMSDPLNSLGENAHSFHEMYGYDVMLDHELKPWLLEVNIMPGLPKPLLAEGQLEDWFNTAGYRIPNAHLLMASFRNVSEQTERFIGPFQPKSFRDTNLTEFESAKRTYFTTKTAEQGISSRILDVLTPADVRELVEAEDEYHRRGTFQRIFPSPTSHKYLKYFERKSYSNLLLDAWTTKYQRNPERGLERLKALCSDSQHLV